MDYHCNEFGVDNSSGSLSRVFTNRQAVSHPNPAFTEDIFIWTARPRHSNCFLAALHKNVHTYVQTDRRMPLIAISTQATAIGMRG